MSEDEVARLHAAVSKVLGEWSDRLGAEAAKAFPEKVTAFREGMAVHGRYGKPCPVCGTPVQRIVYAENESNYCPTCQTGGKLLADRALSQLLRTDWPKTLEELEERMRGSGLRGRRVSWLGGILLGWTLGGVRARRRGAGVGYCRGLGLRVSVQR